MSMTGYGRGARIVDGRDLTIELNGDTRIHEFFAGIATNWANGHR